MPTKANFVPVPGSERDPLPGTRAVVSTPNPNERIEVTVRVRPKPSASRSLVQSAAEAPQLDQRQYLTPAEYTQAYGADAKDIAAVKKFAREHQLEVVSSSIPRRSVVLAGTVEAMNQAFNVNLQEHQSPENGTFRAREGAIEVPSTLDGVVEGVFGLDNRPKASPHVRIL